MQLDWSALEGIPDEASLPSLRKNEANVVFGDQQALEGIPDVANLLSFRRSEGNDI